LAIQQLFRTGTTQAKLAISRHEDPAEREAARLAGPLARGESARPIETPHSQLQRNCAECLSDTCSCDDPVVQLAAEREDAIGETEINAGRIDLVPDEGLPLPDQVRAPLEAQLGTDLSDVRVHDGPLAAEAAAAVRARAFTVGKDIVFSRDAFRP